MLIDQPVVDYGGKRREMGNSRRDVREMDDLAERWRKAHGDGMKGKAFSLGEFARGK